MSGLVRLSAVGAALTLTLRLANRRNLDTMVQRLFVVAAFIATGVGAWFGSFLYTVVLFTGLQTAIYGLYLSAPIGSQKGTGTL